MAREDRAGRGSMSRPSISRFIHGAPLDRKKMAEKSGPPKPRFSASKKRKVARDYEKARRKRLRAKAEGKAGRHGMTHMDKEIRRLDRDARTRVGGGSPGSSLVRSLLKGRR